jgi:putative membrane protein (TIGR04086 family)
VAVTNVERESVLKGMAVAIVICLPLALIADAISNEDNPSRWTIPLYFGVLVGFAIGGFVAARSAHDYPYTNGAVAALGAYVVIQGVGIIVRLAGDDPVHYVGVVFNALLAYGSGLTGGVAGARGNRSSADQ